jgi:hypothetical protein
VLSIAAGAGAAIEFRTADVPWQQVEPAESFTVCMEREECSALDRVSRMVFAIQTGAKAADAGALSVRWEVRQGARVIGAKTAPIPKGMLDATFDLAGLTAGRYDVAAEVCRGGAVVKKASTFFRMVEAPAPAQEGRMALNLPAGVPLKSGSYPVSCGVPFPKGALWSEKNVRVVRSDGTPVAAQFSARSRWGHSDATSIRWLGVDFQAEGAPAWWPERKDTRHFLEFGPQVKPTPAAARVQVAEVAEGLQVDSGALRFLVRRSGFNVIDKVQLGGREVVASTPQGGLYLIDHEGAVYRAANDGEMTLTIEESGEQRAVIRAEGWYVRDGATGRTADWKLPTDRLCRHVTRVEAYAGKPYARVLSTWILTFDSLSVRFKDVGMALPLRGCGAAEFGVEDGAPVRTAVPREGVRLVQHLPHAFAVEDGAGKAIQSGRHSAGWALAESAEGIVCVGHRETWQRFPKEIEVLPDALRLHVWPAHGRTHPEINELADTQMHKLWFAHQGGELNMAMPWKYYWAACDQRDEFRAGIYSGAGTTMAGVHASAMGAAITSDILIHFAAKDRAAEARDVAGCFQAAPHALPDTKWLCDSLAIGYVQPYEPEKMKTVEEIIENMGKAPWETQNATDDYGMWIFRAWHNAALKAPGKWDFYRLYNPTHHYDAFVPWMLYARSGDPAYLTIGRAATRMLTDAQMIHYDNAEYPHRETWSNGRIVGSTRHTNGFVPWGGDHALLGHLTCYNGIMLAHYLTGDLRFREVVAEEWQKTLLTDRANPQYHLADRSSGVGRDASNSLGELLDLYQLTHHPAILGLLPKVMALHLGKMTTWGIPNLNIVLLYGSEQARRQIVDGVLDRRRTNGKPVDPHGVWTGFGYGVPALAWVIDPGTKAHVDAWEMANVGGMRPVARKLRAQEPGAMAFCGIADYLIYLPWTLYAVAHGGGDLSPGALKTPQPIVARKTVVKEAVDQDFEVALRGTVGEGGLRVTVLGPDGKPAAGGTVPAGEHNPWVLRIPKDGQAGEYVIAIPYREPKDRLLTPLTELPEVYLPNDAEGKPGWWWQHAATVYFTRSRGERPETLEIGAHGMSAGALVSRDGMETPDSSVEGKSLKAQIGPDGVWIIMKSVYVGVKGQPILSASPERWFLPAALAPKDATK